MATINSINNKASPLNVDNLLLQTNTLSSTNTNGNIILNPNGTGLVSIASAFTLPRVDGTANQVLKTDGAGVVSWANDASASFNWSVVTGNTQTIVVENGYIANNASQAVVFTLPASPTLGDEFEVIAQDAFGFSVAQNASQQVLIGNQSTTAGTGGSLASTAVGDWIRFVYAGSNIFFASVQQGNITVV